MVAVFNEELMLLASDGSGEDTVTGGFPNSGGSNGSG
jgi:hypothetical protein